jgi:acyl carrier protein
LRQFIIEGADAGVAGFIEDDTNLIDAGVLDSLMMVTLVEFCEDEFKCEIDFDDITDENFRSLETIADFVNSVAR